MNLTVLSGFSDLFGQWQSQIDGVYTFSSPRSSDLNGDGIEDIVIGAGLEGSPSPNGIIALDGLNGDVLWNAQARDQIFGSPIFQDINNDGIKDVFIGGRAGELRALDGQTGNIIWEFYSDAAFDTLAAKDAGIYQFYTPQWIPDQDGDGLQDLLCANGGDPSVLLPNDPRPAGKLMIVSALTGQTLNQADVPDGKETYMSPLVVDFFNDGDLDVVFGTGGEATGGSLWRVPLDDLINNDLSESIKIKNSDNKGFIAVPSLADFNSDNVPDIVVNSYDGSITCINGRNNAILWNYDITLAETNASPGIGYFNDDDVPDVFCNFGIGIAPQFLTFIQIIIDGASGLPISQDSLGIAQFSSPLIADVDGDNFDEIIYCINKVDSSFNFLNEILLIDVNDDEISSLNAPTYGSNVNSTPIMSDLDADGDQELVFAYSADSSGLVNPNGIIVEKLELNEISNLTTVSWGAYIGSLYDGQLQNGRSNCNVNYSTNISINGGENCIANLKANSSGCNEMANDCSYSWSQVSNEQSASLPADERQSVVITHADGCKQVSKIDFDELEISNRQISNTACPSLQTGLARIDFLGGIPPYQTVWNGTQSGGQTMAQIFITGNLAEGDYQFQVIDQIGCSFSEAISIESTSPGIEFDLELENSSSNTENDGSWSLNITQGVAPYSVSINGLPVSDWNNENMIGTGNHTLSVTDSENCRIDSTFVIDIGTGIEITIGQEELYKIFPNPTKSTISLSYSGEIRETSNARLRIFNSLGQVVFEMQSIPPKLDLSLIPPGLYQLIIEDHENIYVKSVLKF